MGRGDHWLSRDSSRGTRGAGAASEQQSYRRSTPHRPPPHEAIFASHSPKRPGGLRWTAVPDQRLSGALVELYAFYARTEGMLENLFRDEVAVPMVAERFAAFRGYFASARDALMTGRNLRGGAKRRTRAVLGHAIAFSTWKSLVREQGLKDREVVELMCGLVDAAAAR